MCGVLGINGSSTLGEGKVLLQMLTHRGQDASGLAWISEKNDLLRIVKRDSYPDLLEINGETETHQLIGSTRYPTF